MKVIICHDWILVKIGLVEQQAGHLPIHRTQVPADQTELGSNMAQPDTPITGDVSEARELGATGQSLIQPQITADGDAKQATPTLRTSVSSSVENRADNCGFGRERRYRPGAPFACPSKAGRSELALNAVKGQAWQRQFSIGPDGRNRKWRLSKPPYGGKLTQ